MNMIFRMLRSTIYPLKTTKTIFFQLFFTFITLSSLLFIQEFFTTSAKNKYSFLDKSVLKNELDKQYIFSEFDEAKKQAEKSGRIVASLIDNELLDYKMLFWLSNRVSYENGIRGDYDLFYCDDVVTAFGFTSLLPFELVYKSNVEGLYISEQEVISLVGKDYLEKDLSLRIYKDDSYNEFIKVPIAGIYRVYKPKGFDVRYEPTIADRIYAPLSVLEMMSDFYQGSRDEYSVSVFFYLKKNINESNVRKLGETNLELHSRALYEYETLETYNYIFNVINIFIYMSCFAMATSVIILFIEKTNVLKDITFIQNIFYKSHLKNVFSLIMSNINLILFTLIISIIIYLIAFILIYILYGYLIYLSRAYYLSIIIFMFIVTLVTVLSYHFIRFKK